MKKSHLSKLFALIVVLVMFFSSFNVFASDLSASLNNSTYGTGGRNFELTIYNHITPDYLYSTNLSLEQANSIYEEVTNNTFDKTSIIEIEDLIYDEQKGMSYSDYLFYIQNNYDSIVQNMSDNDRNTINKYYLAFAIQYYLDNSQPSDFITGVNNFVTNSVNPDVIVPEVSDAMITSTNQLQEDLVTNTNSVASLTAGTAIAAVRIFAISDGTNSSLDTNGHAWLTVTNTSSSNITVGKLVITPNTTISIGTWNNSVTPEHKGLWYSYEGYLKYNNLSSFSGSVSLIVNIDATGLNTLSNCIINSDAWSLTNNCSSFASKAWNQICSTTVSAGVVNTPTNLKNSIMSNSGLYTTNAPVPYTYCVYYANGTGTPILSNTYK